jgi:Fic family protein
LQKNFSENPEKQLAQELCAAHVETEKQFMFKIDTNKQTNLCDPRFLSDLHAAFYAHLPREHQYTHTHEGFTKVSVKPGEFRDVNVSVDGRSFHGPDHSHLPVLIDAFARCYDPDRFHGDERLIAMAASHHRLTWLHPFRDGNGRTARLFSGIYLARIGINRTNLWSLSRGLSRDKKRYMFELWTTDSPGDDQSEFYFDDELLVSFCEFFFEICIDQIRFMDSLLKIGQIDSRIDWYVETRAKDRRKPLHTASSKLLRAVFMRGALPRGEAAGILNMSDRNARRIVSTLLQKGLLQSPTHRAPLTIGLPVKVLPYYFPDLYEPAIIGFMAQ